MSENVDIDKELDEKRTEGQFPDKYKNFSLVKAFVIETEIKNEMRELVHSVVKKVRRHLLKNPNENFKNLRSNLNTAISSVRMYSDYRKTVLTDQVYLLELVRRLTPEQRLMYQDMRKAMGVDVLGHAIEGELSVGEIFGLERQIKGKKSILEDGGGDE